MGLWLAHFSGGFFFLESLIPISPKPFHLPTGCFSGRLCLCWGSSDCETTCCPPHTPGVPSPSAGDGPFTSSAAGKLPQDGSRRLDLPKNSAYPRRAGWGSGAATADWFPFCSPLLQRRRAFGLSSCRKRTRPGTGTHQEK